MATRGHARRRPSRRRLGLALAGGGPAGAVYEIGALRALDEAVEGLDLNACHVYVGVSAGAFIAASLANGLTPAQLVRGLVMSDPGERAFDPAEFFHPAYGSWLRRSFQLPRLLADALFQFTRERHDQTLFESLSRLTRALPIAAFDNEPIRRFLAQSFARPGRTDDFRQLASKLRIVAADLESGTSVIFGSTGLDHVPISTAVQASCAVPGLYPPVEIEGRVCVDGVLLRTVHASEALERGADLLFCINPLVPVDVRAGVEQGVLPKGVLRRRGLPAILSQMFRTMIHSRMVVGMARYKASYPDADVVLFEPGRDAYGLFFDNIFSFRSRREVCAMAYATTRADLWRRRAELGPMLARHGLRLREDVLADASRNVWEGVGLDRERPGGGPAVTDRLARALDKLESAAGG